MQKCVCCLFESEDKGRFCSFTQADKKLFSNLTLIEFNLKVKILKICSDCKTQLKTSANFLKKCLKAYEEFSNEDQEATKQQVIKRTSRRKVKSEEVKELEEVTEEDQNHSTLDDEDDEDDLPILSTIQQQVQEPIEELRQETIETNEITNQDFPDSVQNEKSSDPAPEEPKKKVGKYFCEQCGLQFNTSQRLQVHSFTHSGLKNWKCDYCDKNFATKFRLRAHTRVHTGERPFACDVCPLTFAQGNALKCHKRIHTKERPFKCEICSKSFSQNTTLKTHMSALHIGKSVACDYPNCDKKFTRRSYMILHKRDHENIRKYACDQCSNQYKQKSHLDRHVESSHLGIRYKCDYPGCSSEFSKSWSLKMHKFTHNTQPDQLPYQCQICDSLGFHRRDKWLKHISKNHPDEFEELKRDNFEIQQPMIKTDQSTNFVVSPSNVFTIENPDGSITQVQTLEIVAEEN